MKTQKKMTAKEYYPIWRNDIKHLAILDDKYNFAEAYAKRENEQLKELLLKADYMPFTEWKKERDKLLK